MTDTLLRIVNRDSHVWLQCAHTDCTWRERFAFDIEGTYQLGNGQIIEHGLSHIRIAHGDPVQYRIVRYSDGFAALYRSDGQPDTRMWTYINTFIGVQPAEDYLKTVPGDYTMSVVSVDFPH